MNRNSYESHLYCRGNFIAEETLLQRIPLSYRVEGGGWRVCFDLTSENRNIT